MEKEVLEKERVREAGNPRTALGESPRVLVPGTRHVFREDLVFPPLLPTCTVSSHSHCGCWEPVEDPRVTCPVELEGPDSRKLVGHVPSLPGCCGSGEGERLPESASTAQRRTQIHGAAGEQESNGPALDFERQSALPRTRARSYPSSASVSPPCSGNRNTPRLCCLLPAPTACRPTSRPRFLRSPSSAPCFPSVPLPVHAGSRVLALREAGPAGRPWSLGPTGLLVPALCSMPTARDRVVAVHLVRLLCLSVPLAG